MIRWLAEKISTHMLSKVVAACIAPVSAAAIWFRQELIHHIEKSTPESIAVVLAILALLCLALFALALYLLTSFKYLQKYQFFQHRINGLYYCPTCRNKKPLSPLRYEKTGWRCPFKECSKFYKDPDYVAPEVEVIPTAHHWPKAGK